MQKGSIRIELYDLKARKYVGAHDSELACIALNIDGTRVATSSEKVRGRSERVGDRAVGDSCHSLRLHYE